LSTEQALSIIVGVVLSITLQAIPPINRLWGKTPGKVLILILIHIGGAIALWFLECRTTITTGVIDIICNWEGFLEMAWVGTLGLISNQSAYGLQKYGPDTAKYVTKQTKQAFTRAKSLIK